MKNDGDKSLARYAQGFFEMTPMAPHVQSRRSELIDAVRTLVTERLGKETGDAVAAQLARFPLVSTSDHHAIIDNPYWVNANLITALPCIGNAQAMPHLIVFSFASVSINNASGYPRGIEFHGGMGGEGPTIRLPILPDKLKMGTVYGMRAFTQSDVANAFKLLIDREKEKKVTTEKAALIRAFMNKHLLAEDVLAQKSLSSQITLLNHRLWPDLFHAADRGGAANDLPELIYVDIETLVAHLLLSRHVGDKESLINRALFDPPMMASILQHFDGIPGAFGRNDNSGTYMFWALDEKLHRIGLSLDAGFLVSSDGSFRLRFDRNSIEDALRSGKIFPSTALCYLIVAFHYGMKCLGGFCQVHDLTVLKEAWQKVLRECNEANEADALEQLQTQDMNAGGMMLTYVRTPQDRLMIATGIDMLVERAMDTSLKTYLSIAQNVTLHESMLPMLPGAYSVFYPIHERTIDLTHVSPDTITHGTLLYKKLLHHL
jgi:hypothetical protein